MTARQKRRQVLEAMRFVGLSGIATVALARSKVLGSGRNPDAGLIAAALELRKQIANYEALCLQDDLIPDTEVQKRADWDVASDAAFEHVRKQERALGKMHPHTIEGVRAKAEAAWDQLHRGHDAPDPGYDDHFLAWCIVRDLTDNEKVSA